MSDGPERPDPDRLALDRLALDRLWGEIDPGQAPVAHLVREGRAMRGRRRRAALVGGLAAVVVVGGGGYVAQATGSDDAARQDAVAQHDESLDGYTEVTVFYLVRPGEGSLERARRISPQNVWVPDTGRVARDALTGALDIHPVDRALTTSLFADAPPGLPDSGIEVQAVTHRSGVIRVELNRELWEPYPEFTIAAPARPNGALVTQQLVWTVQTALDSRDPVLFTVDGEPMRGIWGHRLRGPVDAEPGVVQDPQAVDEGPDVAALDLPASSWEQGDLGREALARGRLALDGDQCVVLESEARRTYAIWPMGHSAVVVDGELQVRDRDGEVVARGGDQIEVGGGFGPPGRVRSDCLPRDGEDVFHVHGEVTVPD